MYLFLIILDLSIDNQRNKQLLYYSNTNLVYKLKNELF